MDVVVHLYIRQSELEALSTRSMMPLNVHVHWTCHICCRITGPCLAPCKCARPPIDVR